MIQTRPQSFAWVIPQIAEATDSGDPNSIANSAATQTAAGVLTLDLKGGLSYDFTDPGDGLWWSWRAVDVFGQTFDMGDAVLYQAQTRIDTAFGTSDQVRISFGFSNEADLESATVDGVIWCIQYDGGARVASAGYLLNGADSVGNDATDGAAAYAYGTVSRLGERVGNKLCTLLDANGDQINGANRNEGTFLTVTGDAYFWVSASRSDATAGAVTGDVTPLYHAAAAPIGGRNP